MGNNQPHQTPTTLLQCTNIDTGDIDPFLYFQYRREQRNALSQELNDLVAICELIAQEEMDDTERH